VVPVGSDEGTGDHPADAELQARDLVPDPADAIQLLEGDDPLVGRDLEDAILRRVDDRMASAQMLFAELLQDLRARGGRVAEHAARTCPGVWLPPSRKAAASGAAPTPRPSQTRMTARRKGPIRTVRRATGWRWLRPRRRRRTRPPAPGGETRSSVAWRSAWFL